MAEESVRPPRKSKCKGPNCPAILEWRELNGKLHPFDPDGQSHFKTCCDRDLFRGGAIKTKKSDQKRY